MESTFAKDHLYLPESFATMINPLYQQRINKAIDYINNHLGEKVLLDDLAGVATFSKYHFHRIFKSITGETLNGFIKRLKMEQACKSLTLGEKSIRQIAYDLGYASDANFSRDFSAFYGVSPSEYKGNQQELKSNLAPEDSGINISFIGIKNFPERRYLYKRVLQGYNPQLIQTAFQELYEFMLKYELLNAIEQSVGVGFDDPEYTPAEKCRYDAGIILPKEARVKIEAPFVEGKLSAGNYATFLFQGKAADFHAAWDVVFKNWLIEADYLPDDKPHFELYLPSEEYSKGIFKAQLCLPVVPIV